MKELQRFFIDYKVLEEKAVKVEMPHGVELARTILHEAIALYDREKEHLLHAYS